MANVGIDYGMGRTNRDTENGIRFGVISQHSVTQAWADSAEADYGKPTCPKCDGEAVDSCRVDTEEFTQLYSYGCADYACADCKLTLDSSDCFGEEPLGWNYEKEGYRLTDCLDSDIMVLKSEFYTFAQFCSPCVPGAGNLDNAISEGIKTYCLGHDWFEGGQAPYTVYRVSDDSQVPA